MIRNRIKSHRRVRAGDLIPHELNYRAHPEQQRQILGALYRDIGFARSLLAYELPDGKLKLIDGHLRRDIDPDMQVEVEVLDVNEEEARKLMLTIDPLASLAEQQDQLHERLLEITPATFPELDLLWQSTADALLHSPLPDPPAGSPSIPEQFMILVTCRDEKEQVELLQQFQEKGLQCKALLS